VKKSIYILLLFAFFFTSCTVKKRAYRKGFYMAWSTPANSGATHSPPQKIKKRSLVSVSVTESPDEKTAYACAEKRTTAPLYEIKKPTLFSLNEDCGDEILLRSGEKIKAKVVEVSDKEIKYKRCDNLEGPVIVLEKTSVAGITYLNGVKETFSDSGAKKPGLRGPPESFKETGKKVHPFAPISLTLALVNILVFILLVIGIIIAATTGFTSGSLGFFLVIAGIIAYPLFAILAIVFGAIAMKQIKTSGGAIGGSETAGFGLSLGILELIFLLRIFGQGIL